MCYNRGAGFQGTPACTLPTKEPTPTPQLSVLRLSSLVVHRPSSIRPPPNPQYPIPTPTPQSTNASRGNQSDPSRIHESRIPESGITPRTARAVDWLENRLAIVIDRALHIYLPGIQVRFVAPATQAPAVYREACPERSEGAAEATPPAPPAAQLGSPPNAQVTPASTPTPPPPPDPRDDCFPKKNFRIPNLSRAMSRTQEGATEAIPNPPTHQSTTHQSPTPTPNPQPSALRLSSSVVHRLSSIVRRPSSLRRPTSPASRPWR
jgi:hypothetical protein